MMPRSTVLILPVLLALACGAPSTNEDQQAAAGGSANGLGAGGSSVSAADERQNLAGSGGEGTLAAGGGANIAHDCSAGALGGPMLRRLTALEFNNSLRDVFLLLNWPGIELTPDEMNDLGFNNDALKLEITSARAQQVLAGAESLVALLDWPTVLARLPECTSAPATEGCATAALTGLGRRLFRRPLLPSEVAQYTVLFTELQAQSTFDEALRWSTVALIQSPHTLYRSELGQPEASGYVLSAQEIASSLSYTYAGTAPSEDLLAAAERGDLAEADQRSTWATTLQQLPSGKQQFDQFLQGWLRYQDVRNLAKSVAAFPEFAAVQNLMVEETQRFVDQIVFQSGGTARDLMTSPLTVVDPVLAQFYGFTPSGDGFVSVTRPAGRGIGLLAQGSLLARLALPDSSSPTQRGAFVREKLLCQELPPPPANVAAVPEFKEGVTTRQRYEELHTADPACGGCHRLTDQIGFAFEHYDGSGRYRETELGQAIDASGQLVGQNLIFNGQEQAALALAQLPEIEACVLLHWASFASGLERNQAACLATELQAATGIGVPLANAFARYSALAHFTHRQ